MRALVASIYILVPFCLPARVTRQKMLFTLWVSSLGLGSNDGVVCCHSDGFRLLFVLFSFCCIVIFFVSFGFQLVDVSFSLLVWLVMVVGTFVPDWFS